MRGPSGYYRRRGCLEHCPEPGWVRIVRTREERDNDPVGGGPERKLPSSGDIVPGRPDQGPASRSQGRTARFLLVFLVAAVVAGVVSRLQYVVRWQMSYPFDLSYEGPGLSTLQTIREGGNIYSSALYDSPPFWFSLYTPLYHHLVAWLPFDGPHPFWSGRLVGMLFMGLAAGGLFLAGRVRPAGLLGLLACAIFFSIQPVARHTAYFKSDSMALFFSVAALLCGERVRRPQIAILLSALCAVLAFCSKQAYLAAALALLVAAWVQNRRQGALFALWTAGLAGTAALVASATYGRGFWFCTFLALRRSFHPETFFGNWDHVLRQPVYLCLHAFAIAMVLVALHRDARGVLGNRWFLYAAFSEAVLLLSSGGSGASTNYFIEPVLALLLWLVSSTGEAWSPRWTPRRALAMTAILGVCVAYELATAPAQVVAFTNPGQTAHDEELQAKIGEEMSEVTQGRPALQILNFFTVPAASFLPGRVCLNDPFLYEVLWGQGSLSRESLLSAVAAQYFDVVILQPNTEVRGSSAPEMIALSRHYTFARRGVFDYWTRSGVRP